MGLLASQERLKWSEVLSQTQKALFNLARAMIANFEVLCIHKPTLVFDAITSNLVLGLLRDYVRHKGIAQDESTFHLRRPRTCIFTSSSPMDVEIADQVFCVDHQHGLQRIEKHL